MKDPSTRSMMELICYNVIDYFTRKGIWDFSYQVLVLFEDNLDSFIKSKVRTFYRYTRVINGSVKNYVRVICFSE